MSEAAESAFPVHYSHDPEVALHEGPLVANRPPRAEQSPPSVPSPARLRISAAAILAILVLAPLLVYWPATFHYYGLRDGYSNLREAHEEPGKLIQFCASHARPVYGWLLETTFRRIDTIRQLEWVRMWSALLLGVLSAYTFAFLRSIGWSNGSGFLLAIWIALAPPAQVIAGWSIGWPYALAALLVLLAFVIAERQFENVESTAKKGGWLLTAIALIALSALIYQPSALFYTVPFAATLIARREFSPARSIRWCIHHLLLLGIGLAAAYATISACYAEGIFRKSARVSFEHNWAAKLAWFVSEPLPNALSLFVLNDDHRRNHAVFVASGIVVLLLLLAGTALEWMRHGRARGVLWLSGLLGLPVLAFGISLLADERFATYRTILALTAVILCFLIPTARTLLAAVFGPRTRQLLAVATVTVAIGFARHHTYALLAVPQGNEWRLILAGAEQVRLGETRPSVFVIEPTPSDISTASIYHDEFGSLSSNSEWVPKEMFKRAMHDLHPNVANLDRRYVFSCGERLPKGRHFDLVVDLHRLRDFRTEN